MPLRLAILTVSDAGSRGERGDASGDLIASWAKEHGISGAAVFATRATLQSK